MNKTLCIGAVLLALLSGTLGAAEVALVTALSGKVSVQEEKGAPGELKAFVKVREGDRLMLGDAARVQLVFFESGRQETWQGAATLSVGAVGSTSQNAGQHAEIKNLPAILVRQLSKTPSDGGNVKTGMVRVRSMAPNDRLESVEQNYADMRRQAASSDRTPELYLLASYLELREFDRLESLLARLVDESPGDAQVADLKALYGPASAAAKAAGMP
jgi:hypothetical protein